MKNVIYKITNLYNNKVYIGLTSQGLEQRKREHFSRLNKNNRDHKLYQAMRKYGWNNFKFEILFYCFNRTDLATYEQLFIREYNSFNRGYNMTIGGDFVSDETKLKLSKIFTGRKITWYNKILESRKNNKTDKRQKFHTIMSDVGLLLEVWNLKEFCDVNKLDIPSLYRYRKLDRFHKGYLLIESSTTSQLA